MLIFTEYNSSLGTQAECTVCGSTYPLHAPSAYADVCSEECNDTLDIANCPNCDFEIDSEDEDCPECNLEDDCD